MRTITRFALLAAMVSMLAACAATDSYTNTGKGSYAHTVQGDSTVYNYEDRDGGGGSRGN